MAREALKALSRKHLSGGEVIAYFGALDTESDRAVAILACTTLEDALEDAIRSRMVALSTDAAGHLFSGEGPLSTFSAKTKVGFALGLYGSKANADLNCIRDIRNAFAHAKVPIAFDTKEVADAISTLNAPERLPRAERKFWPVKQNYLLATQDLTIKLLEAGDPFAVPHERPVPHIP